MNIIGINGFKRSGKGETGNAIASLALGVHQLGFADKLKVFAAKSLGFIDLTDAECIALMDDAKETWDLSIKRLDKWDPQTLGSVGRLSPHHSVWEPVKQWSVRQLLQYMGTEARTVFGEDFWVDQVLPNPTTATDQWLGYEDQQHTLHAMYPAAHVLVFTDLRFENEAQRILDLGGFNVRVHREGVTSDGHPSELVLPDELIRYEIPNNGTLDELKWEVNKVLEQEDLMP